MIGKQAMNAVLEMFMPKFYQWFYATTKIKTKKDSKEGQLQWLQDYELLNWGSRGLFPEYLEMGKKKSVAEFPNHSNIFIF